MKTARPALAALLAFPQATADSPSPEAMAAQGRSLAGDLMFSPCGGNRR